MEPHGLAVFHLGYASSRVLLLGSPGYKVELFFAASEIKTKVEQLVELAVNKLRGIKDGRNESKMRGWTGVD
jgi:hypothetical protein